MSFKGKYVLLLIIVILFGCKSISSGQSASVIDSLGNSIFEAKDIAYGSHREQKLDVYLPTNGAGPHPVMFQVHGGAWHWGDKSENEYSIDSYLEQGFAVININYRMGNMNYTLAEKLEDIQSALAFVYSYQDQWNLSDDLTLNGGSAGGHMVLQYGFTLGYGQVDKIISYSGPTDFTNPFYTKNGLVDSISALFKPRNPDREKLEQASPLFSIPEEPGPVVIMVHGNADATVDINDSRRLHEALLQAGWDSTLIEIPGVDHDFQGTDWEWVYSIFGPWMQEHYGL